MMRIFSPDHQSGPRPYSCTLPGISGTPPDRQAADPFSYHGTFWRQHSTATDEARSLIEVMGTRVHDVHAARELRTPVTHVSGLPSNEESRRVSRCYSGVQKTCHSEPAGELAEPRLRDTDAAWSRD